MAITNADHLATDLEARFRAFVQGLDSDGSCIEESGGWKWADKLVLLSDGGGQRRHAMLTVRLDVEAIVWVDDQMP